MVILECKEAFENTELSPLNDEAQRTGPLARQATAQRRCAAPVSFARSLHQARLALPSTACPVVLRIATFQITLSLPSFA
jgi:hypothetical protein